MNATGSEDLKTDGYPWQLALAGVAWLLLGAVLAFAGVGGGGGSAASDQASLEQIGGVAGEGVVAGAGGTPTNILLLLLGIVVLIVAGMLLLGQGWARYVLYGLGLVAVIGLAAAGRWETFLAMGLLVLGSVPLLAPRAHRYLAPSR